MNFISVDIISALLVYIDKPKGRIFKMINSFILPAVKVKTTY